MREERARDEAWQARTADLRQALATSDVPFVVALAHGSMRVELFAPRGVDTQSPHPQDELYLVSRGTSRFVNDGVETLCQAGDVLFVKAGVEHRFVDFSADFETWVIFWGPDGGECRSDG
ncbi:cupin domain-containing protein [Actinopolymorpha sp. B17G11]|uniref:cupin domain-containing protein n=1 Tax=unclassified Actinopolymorpha TaxID=2627063 RepID=UPI0032D9741F